MPTAPMSIPPPPKIHSYSKDTKAMLDSMMSASGMSQTDQRRLRAACAARPSAQLAPARKPLPVGRKPKFVDPLKGVPINPLVARQLPGGGGRVKQADILKAHGGSLDREQYKGGLPGTSSAVKKEELQNLMTYGVKQLPPPSHKRSDAPLAAAAPPAERALRAQIADEIAERQEFLQSMRAMGRAGDHEAKITGEIAERLRDLKDLDRLEAAK